MQPDPDGPRLHPCPVVGQARMRLPTLFLPLLAILALCGCGRGDIRVMTFNVRYDNSDDAENGYGWYDRRELVEHMLACQDPDIAGFQEALSNQVGDLGAMLPGHDHVGVGREDGVSKGEYAPIFWRRDRFELVSARTWWLAPDHDRPNKGWDAALERIATQVVLRETDGERKLEVWNTHFDYDGAVARRESARLILNQVSRSDRSWPCIVMGDFNARPESRPLQILQENRLLTEAGRLRSPSGPVGTTCDFFTEPYGTSSWPLDHILVSKELSVQALRHVRAERDGRCASDHRPVCADLDWD